MSRPQVNVRKGSEVVGNAPLPAVFETPIRLDIVHEVYTAVAKNKRQAHGVAVRAGMQHSAHSWGTGRAVARIPRIKGSGTYAAGQGAFGNMCRGGRMFAPVKTWRQWHVKVNLNTKRYATASAIAASAIAPLVLARGHRVEKISEIPLVVTGDIEAISSTKEAIAFLRSVNAYDDVEKVVNSRKLRAGKGKMRGRRFTQRRGPLIVYSEDKGLTKGFRNLPGVDLIRVTDINILQLAPGSHLGRFIIWSQPAFSQLDKIWSSESKTGYTAPQKLLSNADISGIIESEEIQAAVARVKFIPARSKKTNPYADKEAMLRLNPYAEVLFKEQQ